MHFVLSRKERNDLPTSLGHGHLMVPYEVAHHPWLMSLSWSYTDLYLLSRKKVKVSFHILQTETFLCQPHCSGLTPTGKVVLGYDLKPVPFRPVWPEASGHLSNLLSYSLSRYR